MNKQFDSQAFLLRWVFALALVLLTWNPSGFSWAGWFMAAESKVEAFLLLSGVILGIGWVIFINATLKSLGLIGLALGAAFLGAVLWVFIQYGLLSLESVSVLAWVVLVMVATLLGVGISWSHIRRRLSGQIDVDEIENP